MTLSFNWFTYLSDWKIMSDQIPSKSVEIVKKSDLSDIRKEHRVILDETIVYLPDWAQAILTTCNILVLIVAFCGNIAAIIVVVRSKLSKRSTRWFLISLALSDFILALSSMPIDLGKLMDKYHSWVFGTHFCEIVPAVQTHFFMMNAFCLFAISVERYLTVVRSVKVSNLSPAWELRIPYIFFGVTWLLPFACSVPMLWAYEEWSFWIATNLNETLVLAFNQTFYLCQQTNAFDGNIAWYGAVGFVFFTLLIAFLFCYLSILIFVKTHGNTFRKTYPDSVSSASSPYSSIPHPPGQTEPHGRHQRTVRLIMTLILIFVICRAPNWIFIIIVNSRSTPKTQSNTTVMYFIHLVGSVNTALSPFVYAIWNDSLRTTDSTNGRRNNRCSSGTRTGCFKNNRFGKIFMLGSGNVYDLTTSQNKPFQQSNSTQKYFMSDRINNL